VSQSGATASVDAGPAAGHSERFDGRAIWILLVATLGTASYAFTWNAVGVALPHMKGAFSATTDQVAWVMIAYVLGSAMATAAVGWFSARFGQRRVFLAVVGGFLLTQFGCAWSTSLESEVFWRFVQGLMGAPLVPVSQLIAVRAAPLGRHGQATSFWAIGFIAANVISPTIAGYLIDHFGWPWVFFATVPVAGLCLLFGYLLIPDSEPDPKPMDWVGFLSLIGGIVMLQLALARGERLDWFESTEIVAELLAAGLLLYVFVAHTIMTKRPYLDRALIAERDWTIGIAFIFVIGAVLYLPMLLLPLQLERLGGFPPGEIGYLMMARGAGTVISLVVMSRVRDSMKPAPFLTFGLLTTGIGAFTMGFWTADIRPSDVMVANFIMGLATGSIWAPLNVLALSRLKTQQQDQGFAIFYLVFDVGNAIGAAFFVTLLTRQAQITHAVLSESVTPYSDPLRAAEAAGSAWDPSTAGGLALIEDEIVRQSLAVAYDNCYLLMAVLLWALIPAILLFRRRRARVAAEAG